MPMEEDDRADEEQGKDADEQKHAGQFPTIHPP
jgi:hypothetical protein